MIIVNLLNQTS